MLGCLGWFGSTEKNSKKYITVKISGPLNITALNKGVHKKHQYQYKLGLINVHFFTYIHGSLKTFGTELIYSLNILCSYG